MASDKTVNSTFGRIIAEHRVALGLSQEKLALKSGLDRTFVGKMEKGNHSPSLSTLFKLAKGLETTPAALVLELMGKL
jgi:transcriptional regulator with XRE-family HTH domain